MLFKSFAFGASIFGAGVLAQSSAASSAGAGETHVFSVGANGKTFTPNKAIIPVGDIAEFRFYPQNHSVVKGEFGGEPCIPYELTGAGKVGWWSGWMPTAVVDTSNQPTFRIRINDTNPLSIYCSSPGSCLLGMLVVINGNSTHNLDTQLAATKKTKLILSPGEYFPEEKASDVPQDNAPGQSNTNNKAEDHPHSNKLSTGAIAGIAVGGAVVLALVAALIYMCGRHKSFKDVINRDKSNKNNNNSDSSAYEPASPGMTEANYPPSNYPNSLAAKSPAMTDAGRFSAVSYGQAYSDRSVSPPPDERTQSLYGVMHGSHSPNMQSSQWAPAPMYEEVHEADSRDVKGNSSQVHEMGSDVPASAVISPESPVRPFSYGGERQTMLNLGNKKP